MLPATAPAMTATNPSPTFQKTVKYSRYRPRRRDTSRCEIDVGAITMTYSNGADQLFHALPVAFRVHRKFLLRLGQFEDFLVFVRANNLVGFHGAPSRGDVFYFIGQEDQRFIVRAFLLHILIDKSLFVKLAQNESFLVLVVAVVGDVLVNFALRIQSSIYKQAHSSLQRQ